MSKTIYFNPILEKFLKDRRIKTKFVKRIRNQMFLEKNTTKLVGDVEEAIIERVAKINEGERSSIAQAFLFSGTPEFQGGDTKYWMSLNKEYRDYYVAELLKKKGESDG